MKSFVECMPKMRDEEYGMYAQNEGGMKSMECMPKMRDEEKITECMPKMMDVWNVCPK